MVQIYNTLKSCLVGVKCWTNIGKSAELAEFRCLVWFIESGQSYWCNLSAVPVSLLFPYFHLWVFLLETRLEKREEVQVSQRKKKNGEGEEFLPRKTHMLRPTAVRLTVTPTDVRLVVYILHSLQKTVIFSKFIHVWILRCT